MGFFLLKCKRRKSRYHGKSKIGNIKRKTCAEKRINISLKDLSKAINNHGRHSLLSFLSSLPISVLRYLELEANKFYDRANKSYKAAPLTRCYVQHFLSPYIDSSVNHKRHFIKIPFINKGLEFIDLSPPVKYFTDRSKAVLLLWIFYVFVLSCVCYVLCASVYMCFVVTCWERADLLALVCGVFCEFVTFPLVSWVRCGT